MFPTSRAGIDRAAPLAMRAVPRDAPEAPSRFGECLEIVAGEGVCEAFASELRILDVLDVCVVARLSCMSTSTSG
eukprot:8411905-Lingulodinium_polyedra.AAC.1